MLAVNMLVISIFGSYQTAQAAEIVAGYTIGQILESILLSFGISIFTTEMIQKGTSATWWGTDGSAALKPYYDDLEQAYEEQRFKVINGGGGQNPEPSPTPAPGTTPIPFPTTVPVAGDIPTFQELVAPALAGTAAFINMTQGAWECMGAAVSSLWDKIVNDNYTNNPMNDWNNGTLYPEVTYDGYTYFASSYYTTYNGKYSYYRKYYFRTQPIGILFFKSNLGNLTSYMLDSQYNILSQSCTQIVYKDGEFYTSNSTPFGAELAESAPSYEPSSLSFTCNIPTYMRNDLTSSDVDTPQKRKEIIEGSSTMGKSKETIWVHPDLQDTYQNNGKLEYPQQAPQPLQIPSGDQLADLSKKLNPEINTEFSPEMAPSYIAELIQQLQKGLNPDPDPDPDPNPNPNPNPDPDPDPNPNPTGSPDPEPTKAPEEDSSNDIDPKNYTTDLKRIFPFCIPFDLVHLIQAFEAEPEAPVFEIPFDLELEDPWTGKKIVNYHHTFKLDFSDYESVIEIFRIFEVIFFIIGLLLITRQQMIKG